MSSIAIIVPCYNEEKRINTEAFLQFFSTHPEVNFYFVNDGSTDNTGQLLNKFKEDHSQINIISLSANKGKGEAVRQGILTATKESNYSFIGYLDADLSTSLEEFYELYIILKNKNADLIFGSRIKKLDSRIKRSTFRHVTGRILATVIDKKFLLGCYDTQCGAKIFKAEIITPVLQKPFFTKWFFDVEIFVRLKHQNENYSAIEFPLKNWHNVKGSKINFLSFPTVLKELYILLNKY